MPTDGGDKRCAARATEKYSATELESAYREAILAAYAEFLSSAQAT